MRQPWELERVSRREFVTSMGALGAAAAHGWAGESPSENRGGASDRVEGLLIGGLLGDALGGPVEFADPPKVEAVLPGTRAWGDDRTLTGEERTRLANGLSLLSYEELRPKAESYGPWRDRAPAGTVTDDSRHKIVLMRALRKATESGALPLSVRDLARQYIDFTPLPNQIPTGQLAALNDEGFREYRYAARWLIGGRDPAQAMPLERLWAGIDNCSGQMLLPPLAAVYPGQPEAAYRAAYALDFVDTPGARDLAAALVAALAAALDPRLDSLPLNRRWEVVLHTLRSVDPYRYAEVPFAGRPLQRWLDRVDRWVATANGHPATLFRLLETEGHPVYWWDAHFTLIVPLAMLKFCEYDPLAALSLTLDFGHDTDSYAQIVGCLVGAVGGASVFPAAMRQQVAAAVRRDFGVDLAAWQATLADCAERQRAGQVVIDVDERKQCE